MELAVAFDFSRRTEPGSDPDLRRQLTAWLAYQRGEFQRKLRDLTPEQLVAHSVPPVELSVMGLVRHMRQVEHGYLTIGLGGGIRDPLYGEDDYAGATVEAIDDDVRGYLAEIARADAAVAAMPSLDAVGLGHGRSLAWTLVKMVDEYAIHAGQAHMLRFAALGTMLR